MQEAAFKEPPLKHTSDENPESSFPIQSLGESDVEDSFFPVQVQT